MKIPQDWSNMAESWTLADKASGRILNMLKLPNKIGWQAVQQRITMIKFRNYEGMNNDLCSVISKIFAYKTNITKMEKGPLTDCINMRYHTKRLIKDDSNIVHLGSRIQSHHIYQQKIVMAEIDRKRILRKLRTCLYLVSACWKASMRPCPEHNLPIWRYSDSYQKQTTS